jgi:phosphatidyl-myo-inositol dimannoside synthase
MKILFVSNKYPPYVGGAQTQHQILSHKLAETESVRVAILRNGQERHGLTSRALIFISTLLKLPAVVNECLSTENNTYVDKGVTVRTLGLSVLEKISILVSRGGSADRILKKKLIDLMQDVDIVHCIKPDWLSHIAKKAARKIGVPFAIVPYIHGTSIKEKLLLHLKSSDIVFALSEADKDRLVHVGVPPNLIQIMGVAPLISSGGNAMRFRLSHGLNEAPIVLYVGRMIKYKGARAILNATDLVWRSNPNTHFVFIGPPADNSSVFSKYSDKRLVYLGMVSEEEKADALAACNIFCMPSKYEIVPAVYLEAWTYEKPVIGGTAHGLKELIEENCAGLISTQDPDCLASTLVKLLNNRELCTKMGRAGKELVDDEYTTERIAKRMLSAYKAVIPNKGVATTVGQN